MSPRKKKIALGAAVLLVVAAGAFAAWWWLGREEDTGILEVYGTVESTDALVGFEIAGTVESVAVEEGDTVAEGETLARLRSEELEARRAQMEARVASAAARLRELETGSRPEEIARARAQVRAAAEELEQARRELRRTETLYQGGAVSRSAYDQAKTAAEVAASRLEEAREQLQLVREGPKPETVDAQRGVLEEARSALAEVEARLEKTTLAAPFSGRVAERHKEPGELAAPGAPVVTLRNLEDRWVRVYVPEDRLGAVHLGDPATILSDTYPDARYDGRIFYIADRAEFTPKTVQTKEERVRLVYAAKVRVTGDPGHELKPGMPVDVEIDVGTGHRAGRS